MNELVTQSSGLIPATTSASLEAIKSNFGIIQEAQRSVLIRDTHFGVIPGTKGKPSLLKPGADVLCALFHLSPSYEIEKESLGNGHREYQVTCTLHGPSGNVLGQGVGSSSTMEPKYRYRKAEQTCPECGSKTIIKGKQEYGGGWLCYKAKGGCGAKFNNGDERIENQDMGRIEHPDPAEYYNTCLKMASKRSFVSAVLTVTGASAVFTQDVEDMRGNIIDADYEESIPAPSIDDLLSDIAAACNITTAEDFAPMKSFLELSAKTQKKDFFEFCEATAANIQNGNFEKAYKAYYKKQETTSKKETAQTKETIESKAKPTNKEETPDIMPAQEDGFNFSEKDTLINKIGQEMHRLNIAKLPSDLAKIYGDDPVFVEDVQDLKSIFNTIKARS